MWSRYPTRGKGHYCSIGPGHNHFSLCHTMPWAIPLTRRSPLEGKLTHWKCQMGLDSSLLGHPVIHRLRLLVGHSVENCSNGFPLPSGRAGFHLLIKNCLCLSRLADPRIAPSKSNTCAVLCSHVLRASQSAIHAYRNLDHYAVTPSSCQPKLAIPRHRSVFNK